VERAERPQGGNDQRRPQQPGCHGAPLGRRPGADAYQIELPASRSRRPTRRARRYIICCHL